jgi:hypothetical protein
MQSLQKANHLSEQEYGNIPTALMYLHKTFVHLDAPEIPFIVLIAMVIDVSPILQRAHNFVYRDISLIS